MTTRISMITLPIGELAMMLEEELKDYLVKPAPTWYSRDSHQPILVPGRTYSQEVGERLMPLLDPTQVCGNIYDDTTGALVFMHPGSGVKSLYQRPIAPITGMQLIKEFVDTQIDNDVEWVQHKSSFYERVQKFVNHDYTKVVHEVVTEQGDTVLPTDQARQMYYRGAAVHTQRENDVAAYIDERCRGLLADIALELARFMGQDLWNTYYTEIKQFHLRIEKNEDYRVLEWKRLRAAGVI